MSMANFSPGLTTNELEHCSECICTSIAAPDAGIISKRNAGLGSA
jgi:hypothetical protein